MPEQDSKGVFARIAFGIECAVLLFLGSMIAGALLWGPAEILPTRLEAIVVAGVPAMAALLLLASGALVPALFRPARRGFPLNVTLPGVFLLLKLLSLSLVTTEHVALVRSSPILEPALQWAQPLPLLTAALVQALLLTLPLLPRAKS
jgi:hypothetical protein